jgi:hypothetical protein
MLAEVPAKVFREVQPGIVEKRLTLKHILEGKTAPGGGLIPAPCAQLASTRSRGDRSSIPRMTSVAFPGAA